MGVEDGDTLNGDSDIYFTYAYASSFELDVSPNVAKCRNHLEGEHRNALGAMQGCLL